MSVTKRRFTREFKIQVISEIEQGLKTRAQATREYELSEGIVNKWIQAYRKDPQNAFSGHGADNGENSEIEKLKSKISQLEWALGRKSFEVEMLKEVVEKLKVKRG